MKNITTQLLQENVRFERAISSNVSAPVVSEVFQQLTDVNLQVDEEVVHRISDKIWRERDIFRRRRLLQR
tara:strand:- start:423 stop:632 length:210 start_codon:yes stop_codon:yes gene_type:complete